MRYFEKSDLKYSYTWDESKNVDCTKKIRFYDTYILDTDDGYAVLQFINSYMNKIKRWLNENYFF